MKTALAGLAALALAIGVGRFAFTPLLPMMQSDAGISVAQGGWLAAANYAGYLVGALFAAALPLRPATAIRASLLATGLLTLAMGFAHGLAAWLALRALAGVASAWVLVFVSAWSLERLAAAGRGELSGVVFAGVGTGIAAVGGLCLFLMYAGSSSAQAWIALGGLALVVTAIAWGSFGESSTPPKESPVRAPLAWNAESLRLVLCYGAFGYGYIIPATFLPAMAKQALDAAVFGWAWPLFGAAAALSTLVTLALPRAAGGAGQRRLWTAAQLVMALGVALPALSPGIAAILGAALCVGGTFMVITMAGIREAQRVAGAQARGLIAAMTSAFAAGQILGPLSVSAALAAGGDVPSVLLFASALLAASTAALWQLPAR